MPALPAFPAILLELAPCLEAMIIIIVIVVFGIHENMNGT